MTTDQLVIGGNVNDSRDSTVHLSGLLDVNSAVLLRERDDSGALVTKGGIDTAKVFAYGTDTRVMGALMTGPGRRRVVKAAVIHQSSRRAELVAEPGVFRPSGPGPDLRGLPPDLAVWNAPNVVDGAIAPTRRGPRRPRKHPSVNRTEESMRLANGRTR